LHPLSELRHPIIAKAVESFGADPDCDNYVGPVFASTTVPLLEIKTSQWRGGVGKDTATGVHWLVVAGLAKGDHQDHDDFYQRVHREDETGDPTRWLPTERDVRLLRQESMARVLTEWHLAVQAQMLNALRIVRAGGSTRITIRHPPPDKGNFALLVLSVTPLRDPGYQSDDIDLEVRPTRSQYAGGALLWELTIRALISLSPPEQGWDRYKDTFSNIAEPGYWATRVEELEALAERNELAESVPGRHSHYAHRAHLAGATIRGRGVRGLCGVFFVPTQDHEALPTCPECAARLEELPE
jgi:hypothetical protein